MILFNSTSNQNSLIPIHIADLKSCNCFKSNSAFISAAISTVTIQPFQKWVPIFWPVELSSAAKVVTSPKSASPFRKKVFNWVAVDKQKPLCFSWSPHLPNWSWWSDPSITSCSADSMTWIAQFYSSNLCFSLALRLVYRLIMSL